MARNSIRKLSTVPCMLRLVENETQISNEAVDETKKASGRSFRKKSINLMRSFAISVLLMFLFSTEVFGQTVAKPVKQPRDVVEAYQVCQQFRRLLATDLNFDPAYEATFTKNAKRRREIAITDGEFGNVDLTGVDDLTLVNAYKSRMQIFYLLLPLAGPDNKEEETLFFPTEIKEIFERKPPLAVEEFRTYTVQLNRDATQLREHVDRLVRQYPSVANRVRKFKMQELSRKLEPPNHVVEPLYAYRNGRLLGKDQPYYSIDGFTVVREDAQMRIVGIRFFTRLF